MIKNYLQLMRFDKPIGTLLLLYPTLWSLFIATNGIPSLKLLIVFTLGVFLMRSSGCVISDFFDSEFDRHVARTNKRPLVIGVISRRNALMFGMMLSFLALCVAMIWLKTSTILMSIPAFFIAITYPLMKRFFAFPQLYLGIAFSFGILMTFIEVQSKLPLSAWLLFIANIFWTFGYDTIYALVDKPDDIRLNMHSSAKTLGRFVIFAIAVCYLFFAMIMLYVGILLNFIWLYFILLLFAYTILGYQLWNIRYQNRDVCFQMFLTNNKVGLIILCSVIVNYF